MTPSIVEVDWDEYERLLNAEASIQTCKKCEKKYVANSHEYPCPHCVLESQLAELQAEQIKQLELYEAKTLQAAALETRVADLQAEIKKLRISLNAEQMINHSIDRKNQELAESQLEVEQRRAEVKDLTEYLNRMTSNAKQLQAEVERLNKAIDGVNLIEGETKKLRLTIEQLRAALEKYGRHHPTCGYCPTDDECYCDYIQTMKALNPKGDAGAVPEV